MARARIVSRVGADTPKRGMSVNLITKSGGNAYHGALEYAFTNNNFESDNITATLRRQGVVSAPKLITRKDGGGQLGGKLIEDRLWFFADLRYRKVIREIPFAAQPLPYGRGSDRSTRRFKRDGPLALAALRPPSERDGE